MSSRRTFFKDARSLLVDAFGRDLEERRPWRGGEFVIRIHTNVDGICINGKGIWEFGCSERELGEGFGFGDPGSVVVVRVRLFTFLGAIEAMRFVWVAMVTDGWGRLSNGPRITFFEVFSITVEEVLFG